MSAAISSSIHRTAPTCSMTRERRRVSSYTVSAVLCLFNEMTLLLRTAPNNYEAVHSVSDGTLQIEQESLLKVTRRRTDNEMYGEAAWLFQIRPSSATIGPIVTQKLYSIQYDEHGIPMNARITRQSRKCKPINIGTGRPWLHTTYGAKSFGILRKKKLDPWWIWNTFAERDPTKVQVRVTSAGWILEPSIWQKQREEARSGPRGKGASLSGVNGRLRHRKQA